MEAALDRVLPRPPACPAVLADAVRYSVQAGGKRLRPILVLAAADAVAAARGTDRERARAVALPAACAVEMIHTYSLIHDDLPAMDDDSLRRGRPTLHVVAGDGMAILAGDGLQAEAFALLAREPVSDDASLVDAQAAGAGAGGDGRWRRRHGRRAGHRSRARPAVARQPAFDAVTLADMHARKTGALIRAAAVAGAVMAGGDGAMEAAVGAWASEVGLAFQIVDDVLDVEGAAAETGQDRRARTPPRASPPTRRSSGSPARRPWPPRRSRGPTRP